MARRSEEEGDGLGRGEEEDDEEEEEESSEGDEDDDDELLPIGEEPASRRRAQKQQQQQSEAEHGGNGEPNDPRDVSKTLGKSKEEIRQELEKLEAVRRRREQQRQQRIAEEGFDRCVYDVLHPYQKKQPLSSHESRTNTHIL